MYMYMYISAYCITLYTVSPFCYILSGANLREMRVVKSFDKQTFDFQ